MSTPWEITDQASRMLREAQEARADIRNLLAEITRQREEMAGIALWCSLGLHAFGSQDRKRTVFKIQTFDEDTGRPIEEAHVACGPCAAKRRGALQPQAAIPAGVDKDQYTAFLEWQNGMRDEPPTRPGE